MGKILTFIQIKRESKGEFSLMRRHDTVYPLRRWFWLLINRVDYRGCSWWWWIRMGEVAVAQVGYDGFHGLGFSWGRSWEIIGIYCRIASKRFASKPLISKNEIIIPIKRAVSTMYKHNWCEYLGTVFPLIWSGSCLTNICLTELTSCSAEWIGLICYFSSVDVAVTISRVS